MEECEFCHIVSGASDTHVLYEDEQTVAFLDRNPAIQGHTLVVPRVHHKFLFMGDEPIATGVFQTVRRVALAIDRTMEPDGVSLFYTSADLVGQVTHAHVHLMPRYIDDDIHIALSRKRLNDDEAANLAARIQRYL